MKKITEKQVMLYYDTRDKKYWLKYGGYRMEIPMDVICKNISALPKRTLNLFKSNSEHLSKLVIKKYTKQFVKDFNNLKTK